MEWFWLALAIGLLVVEIVTTQFVTVWFAASAGVVAIITANNTPTTTLFHHFLLIQKCSDNSANIVTKIKI